MGVSPWEGAWASRPPRRRHPATRFYVLIGLFSKEPIRTCWVRGQEASAFAGETPALRDGQWPLADVGLVKLAKASFSLG